MKKTHMFQKILSILKYSIPEFIKSNPRINEINNTEIEDASIEDGGSGAFYIYLKKI